MAVAHSDSTGVLTGDDGGPNSHFIVPLCSVHLKKPRHSSLLLHLLAQVSIEGLSPICHSWFNLQVCEGSEVK